jgi:hypothetical protein
VCPCRSERGATVRIKREATIRDTDAAPHFTTLYSGLLGRDNWILVEAARDAVPARITIRKSDGRALIDACSPFEISYATFAALVADKWSAMPAATARAATSIALNSRQNTKKIDITFTFRLRR